MVVLIARIERRCATRDAEARATFLGAAEAWSTGSPGDPQDPVAWPVSSFLKRPSEPIRRLGKCCLDVFGQFGNQVPMVARRRETEDREHARPNWGRISNPLAVLEGTTRRCFQTPEVCLDLDQDDRAGGGESYVGRGPTGARDPSLDFGSPARIATPEQPRDDPGVGDVVEHRRRSWIDGDSKVGSKGDCCAAPDLESYRRVAPFEFADDRLAHAHDSCHRRLRDVQAESELAQLLRKPGRIESGEADGLPLHRPPRSSKMVRHQRDSCVPGRSRQFDGRAGQDHRYRRSNRRYRLIIR